jgi:hypothetical protein
VHLALGLRHLVRVRKEGRPPPDHRVVRALRRQGLGRRVEETPGEYAARVQMVGGEAGESSETEAEAETEAVARLAELAGYAPRPCMPDEARDAQALAAAVVEVKRRYRRHRRRRRRVSHAVWARGLDADAGGRPLS